LKAAVILGAVGDGLKLLGQLLALNGRKSWWILRGRQSNAPCQHPSDSGRAGESECEACKSLAVPGRLRAVCPLLKSTKSGWVCSADSARVRPFWGRSCFVYASLLATLYLGAATATYSGMRFVGYPGLTWWQVAWPGSWTKVTEAQSRYFLEKAGRLFQAGRPAEAMLSLSTAIRSDPSNFEAHLLVAQIWSMQGNYEFSGRAFDELCRRFPEQALRIALARHDTLVTMRQGQLLAEYALAQARTDRNRFAFWIQSMLFGLRLSQQAEAFTAASQKDLALLPEYARRLVEMEALLQQGRNAEAKAWLERPFAGPWNAIYARAQVDMLIRIGANREAGTLLGHYGIVLGDFQRDLLRFTLNKSLGDEVSAQADLHGLLAKRLSAAYVNYICAALVRFPDRNGVNRLHAVYGADAGTLPQETAAAIWLVAILANEPQIAQAWAGTLKAKGIPIPAVNRIDFSTTDLANNEGVPFLINFTPLPRDVVQALALRVKKQ
jgi:tetratricopeptide (TPR) repeat protein